MKSVMLWWIFFFAVAGSASAQDAMVLSPEGPQPWLRMPDGAGNGVDLWIPMVPPSPWGQQTLEQHLFPSTPSEFRDRGRDDSGQRQLEETGRAVQSFREQHALPLKDRRR